MGAAGGVFFLTFISLTAIPVSLLMTVLVFWAMGMTINTMTLGGLAVAIGELVDDAIVEVENIVRHLRMGKKPRQAAMDAASVRKGNFVQRFLEGK